MSTRHHTSPAIYFVALSVGSALGIPISYILGWIDDKIDSVKASLILCLLYLFALIPMLLMTPDNIALCALVAFGIGCMGGGCPTMHPSITSNVYGRKKYQSANKWIMTIQSVIMAFAVSFMAHFASRGNMTPAYWIMLGMLAVASVALLGLLKTPDANLAERDYATK